MSAFRGQLPARALLVDVPLVGEVEARRRVVETWQSGAALFDLPTGAWLLEFDQAVAVRAELAAGLVLVETGGVLHPHGTSVEGAQPGDVLVPTAGTTTRLSRAALPRVDRSSWLDLTDLRIEPLAALDRAVVAAATPAPWQPPPPAPDLRAVAAVGPPPRRTRRLRSAATRSRRRRRLPDTLVAKIVAAIVGYGLAALVAAPHPTLVLALGTGLFWVINSMLARSTAGAAGGGGQSGRGRSSGGWWDALLARLVRASSAVRLARNAQHRYVRRLTAAFERRDWDRALRAAIAVGGPGGRPTLRLPRPRTGDLVPHPQLPGAAGVPFDVGAQQHLRTLYRRAATELDRAGRVAESAFVLADLLDLPAEAVALLERHRRYQLAATLAEGRELDPGMAVRLWWRAGDRDRALLVARTRGAFAAAVERLARVDAAAARQLRAEWVRARQAADDHLGAVEAAWPDDTLRPLVVTNIQAGMALGGPTAGHLLAHLVTWRPSSTSVSTAIALLDGRDKELAPAQRGFVAALAGLRCTDRATDRRLCTAALRLLVRDPAGGPGPDAGERWRFAGRLRDRADRLAAADLPPLPASGIAGPDTPVDISAAGEPGQLPIHDAVLLSGRAILTAHGDFGVRLIGLDGQTRASWDVPAHQLVVADHGANVLLVARRGSACTVRGLDLSTRRLRPTVAIRAHRVLPSYDGALLTVVDDDGIAFVDLSADVPRVAWRELDSDVAVLDIARSPTSLAALLRITGQPGSDADHTEVWRWDLPGLMLRTRRPAELDGLASVVLLASSALITTSRDEATDTYRVKENYAAARTVAAEPTLLTGGTMSAVRIDRPTDTTVEIGGSHLRVVFPAAAGAIGMRHHADTLTVWEENGRLVVVDLTRRQAVARLRTRL
ncbi:bpX6 domain-containing protein [Micromonospora sp. NPDC049047]|uniref:bpX6 domain-containing protein n=1 Tax=Micromonospora sp. NPDC049047 TaxID=3155645 RepID=UPI0033D0C4CC